MGFWLNLICMVASLSSLASGNPHLHFYDCPNVSGPSIVNHIDKDNTGVERIVVFFYRPKNSRQIIPFIPSKAYQKCILDIPAHAGEISENFNDKGVKRLFDMPERTIRYPTSNTDIEKEPNKVWTQLWDKHPHRPHENFDTKDNEHNIPVITKVNDNHDAPDVPSYYDINTDKPDWHLPVQERDYYDLPWVQNSRPTHPNHEFPEDTDLAPPIVFENDGSETHDPEKPRQPNHNYDPLVHQHDQIPWNHIDQHYLNEFYPNELETDAEPEVIRPINDNGGTHHAPDIDNNPNNFNPLPEDSDVPDFSYDNGPEELLPIENIDINPQHPDRKLPKITEDITAPETEPGVVKIPTNTKDYDVYPSNEVRPLKDENGNTLFLPKGQNHKFVYGDFDVPFDWKKYINSYLPYKHLIDKASVPGGLNVVYKWHTVKEPHIDKNGKIYWITKTVRSPVKNPVKWSYYVSGKDRPTIVRNKSTVPKIFHDTDNGIPAAHFDAWLKKQISNIRNDGSKIPPSDDYMYSIKLAMEKALNTNGIRLESGGLLVDAKGNEIRLENIQLRPIYIGRSLAFNRLVKNSGKSLLYNLPGYARFVEAFLVTTINPPRSLGIVPLGVTSLHRVRGHHGRVYIGAGRQGEPNSISIKDEIHRLLSRRKEADDVKKDPDVLVDEGKPSSEEEPEYRIIGGSFAVGSGSPLANKGRSGKD